MLAQFVAEVVQMVFGEAAFEKSPRIDARRGVSLEINQVARLIAVTAMEEMIETHFEQRGERGIRGDVAADPVIMLVLVRHHGHGVPASQALNAAFQRAVTGIRHFLIRAKSVHIVERCANRNVHAGFARALRKLLEQESGPVRPRFLPRSGQALRAIPPFREDRGRQAVR